jgi:hypothetical protein
MPKGKAGFKTNVLLERGISVIDQKVELNHKQKFVKKGLKEISTAKI